MARIRPEPTRNRCAAVPGAPGLQNTKFAILTTFSQLEAQKLSAVWPSGGRFWAVSARGTAKITSGRKFVHLPGPQPHGAWNEVTRGLLHDAG